LTRDGASRIFFAYPSKPESRREAIALAAESIGLGGQPVAFTWEDLTIAGRIGIDRILAAIDDAVLTVFDITDLNPNVLFELGYAIGSGRQVWLTRDGTDELAARSWKRFGLLRSVIHLRYANSDEIVSGYRRERPDIAKGTLFDDLIAPSLTAAVATSVFYFKSVHDTNASRYLTRAIEEVLDGATVVTADPEEGSLKPLGWYAQELFNTRVAIVHLTGEGRYDAAPHNARCALVAGLAHGLGKPLLMLAETGYQVPFDYQDLLYVYRSAKDCDRKAREWLSRSRSASVALPSRAAGLASDLKALRLGSHIAEDERATLGEYFIETRNYLEVLGGATTVFVGRKGTGKTANFIRASQELTSDRRNLVCAIKPPAYEIDDVVSLLGRYRDQDNKGYMIESLWKYLLFTEIARAAAIDIGARIAVPEPSSYEGQLLSLLDDPASILHEEFAVRLERGVRQLLEAPTPEGVEARRGAISEALHASVLRDLRELLGHVLTGRNRVAILIDNLDKGWERDADIQALSTFLLGLLGSIRQVASEFERSDSWRHPIPVSLAVFLRSDIYVALAQRARERDKLPVSELSWADSELLLRVIEDRYAASSGGSVDGSELWTKYFAERVHGTATKRWLSRVIIPRPRDLVYLCNAAITNAVNRGHEIVEEVDLVDAAEDYSHFALESIVVEGEVTHAKIEDVLYEFVGSDAYQSESEIRARIDGVRLNSQSTSAILEFLTQVSFLGPQVSAGSYEFLGGLDDQRRLEVLSRKAATRRGRTGRSFMIHPAFWPYLDIVGPDPAEVLQ
jgi:hypothetical protein